MAHARDALDPLFDRDRPQVGVSRSRDSAEEGGAPRRRRRLLRTLAAIGVLLSWGAGASSAPAQAPAPERRMRLEIPPYLSAELLTDRFAPLVAHLGEQLGGEVELRLSRSHADFLRAAARGRVEISFVPSAYGFHLAETADYEVLALARTTLSSWIFVRAASPIARVADLRGRRIIAPHEVAVVTIAARALLIDAGLTPGEDVILSPGYGHDQIVLEVLEGRSEVGVTSELAFARLAPGLRERLRLLASRPVGPAVLIASRGLAAETRERIRDAVMHFQDTPEGESFTRSLALGRFSPGTRADLRPYGDPGGAVATVIEQARRELWPPRSGPVASPP